MGPSALIVQPIELKFSGKLQIISAQRIRYLDFQLGVRTADSEAWIIANAVKAAHRARRAARCFVQLRHVPTCSPRAFS